VVLCLACFQARMPPTTPAGPSRQKGCARQSLRLCEQLAVDRNQNPVRPCPMLSFHQAIDQAELQALAVIGILAGTSSAWPSQRRNQRRMPSPGARRGRDAGRAGFPASRTGRYRQAVMRQHMPARLRRLSACNHDNAMVAAGQSAVAESEYCASLSFGLITIALVVQLRISLIIRPHR